jgi:hypothetical protein
VACGYDTIEEMLVKHGEVTSGHPVDFGYTEHLELSGNRNERKGDDIELPSISKLY